MRITIVLGAFFPVPPIMGGAVEKVWFALAQEFARQGHEVVQISRSLPQLARAETIEGVKHIRVRGYDTPGSLLWLKMLDLFYSVRAKRILPAADIVVTNTFWLPILLRDRKRGKLYVHIARYPKGQMSFYRHAARLQTPSRAIARAIVAEVPALAPKVTAIPNPLPEMSDSPLPPFSSRALHILYVGRVHPEKGVHLLIGAFSNLAADFSAGWKLVVIGPWETKFGGGGKSYWEELCALKEKAGAAIEFRGPIFQRTILEEELRNARLFVYPSLAEQGETFGLAPLEAMAHGCPVLVSDLECFADFVRDEETGFVFDHRSPDPPRALQARIAHVLKEDGLLARIGEAGRQKSDEFSPARVARQFLDDFEQLQENGAHELSARL